jgi:hypothetical protein
VSPRHDLFAVAPEEFVAARDQLVRELRAAGDKDEAADVKRLRRPAVPVWALNQVASADPRAVHELLDASADARTAQDEVLAGADADVLRAALARRKQALAAVSRAARDVLDASGRPGDAHVRDVESALNTIVASERLGEDLRRGELTTIDADEDAGDDLLSNLSASVEDRPARSRMPSRVPSRGLRNAREKLEQHRTEAVEAADRLVEAEREVADAEAAVARAERDLAAARRAHHAAQQTAARADQAVARSEDAVARLEE